MRKPFRIVATIIAIAAVGGVSVFGGAMATPLSQAEDPTYGLLSLRFEPYPTPDGGETFISRGTDYAFVWNGDEAAIFLQHQGATTTTDVRMKLLGAASKPSTHGTDPLPGKSHYFLGNDPSKWRIDVPHYARVRAAQVYPGVDLVIYGNEQQLEYDFVLDPGVDPAVLTLGFEGVDRMEINEHGDLVLHVPGGELIHRAPYAYQQVDGAEKPVASRYDLRPDGAVGFELLADYDTDRPLIIDPVLVYSTYLGGEGEDFGHDIAVDATGHSYVTGQTLSVQFNDLLFPTTKKAFQEDPPIACFIFTCTDAFVSKLTPAGDDLVYSTFLGGIGIDQGNGIAVDADGNAYITGQTSDDFSGPNDFPITPNAAQGTPGGSGDAFLVKLDSSGKLLYSTYLGGSERDKGNDITVGDDGVAVLVGGTESSNFPVTPGAFRSQTDGNDGFLARIDTSGDTEAAASLLYATFLGGGTPAAPSGDSSDTVVLDDAGNAWVSGTTFSPDFPITADAYQPNLAGASDLYLIAVDPAGALLYSTYFGGSGREGAGGLALDGEGFAYLAGSTSSSDFPVTLGAFQTVTLDDNDGFVVKLSTTVAGPGALVYSTLLGGTGSDRPHDIAIDDAGNAYVTGGTGAEDFPLQNNLGCGYNGGLGDIFVSVLDSTGSHLVFSTYMGTPARFRETGEAIAVGPADNLYVTGSTVGDDSAFRTTEGAFQEVATSVREFAFVTKINVWDLAPAGPVAFAGPDQVLACSSVDGAPTITLDASGSCDPSGGDITYSWNGPFGIAEEPAPMVQLPAGSSEVTLTVTNALGQTDSDTVVYDVQPSGPLGFKKPLPPLVSVIQPPLPEFFQRSFDYGSTLPLSIKMVCGETVVDSDPNDMPSLFGVFRTDFSAFFSPDVDDLDSGRSNEDGGEFRPAGNSWVYNLNTTELSGPGLYFIVVELADGRLYYTGVRLD